MSRLKFLSIVIIFLLSFPAVAEAQQIIHNAEKSKIELIDNSGKLQIEIDYQKGCRISRLLINGVEKLSSLGCFTSIKPSANVFSSLESEPVSISLKKNTLIISGVRYGDKIFSVNEIWRFTLNGNSITWDIQRQYNSAGRTDNMAMPEWHFAGNDSWKGGILNTGGVVWCKYLDDKGDTYGVHTDGVTFWEPVSGDGLTIQAKSGNKQLACSFSLSNEGNFKMTQYVTDSLLLQRYNLNRFIAKKPDVFAPFTVGKGMTEVSMEMSYVDYAKEYDRGKLPGIDAIAVRELMNTTGRYGVVDQNIIGANGWLTNWKCLHEPFFARIGMALDDSHYISNFSSTLDFERDNAIEPDGRVLARWHNVPEARESNYNFRTGYYDCPWGYTLDAQPSQVINTVEQFNLNGDLEWLRSHKVSSEKILDWLIRRDSNNNGIFEMLNDNIAEKKCSDWIDVVWAGFENSFVNAMMHEALRLWSECEMILGDNGKAAYYLSIADRLKESFNKPVNEGGFWLPEKKQYIYWRDRDGSLHGDNLVTPVNFAAIAFGVCADQQRINDIIGQIETRTSEEHLFHWPLCFDSFRLEEVNPGPNWPFPNYENGDIFPTWGYIGVRSYIRYDRTLALKYITNILDQYKKDGLSSQRFSRKTQTGIGEDILAGICTTITALYSDIYGISPKWNRMGLEPNMIKELNGTEFRYRLREQEYLIRLDEDRYQMSTGSFTAVSGHNFGISVKGKTLKFYPGNKEPAGLSINSSGDLPARISFGEWTKERKSWIMDSGGSYQFVVSGLKPDSDYALLINDNSKQLRSGKEGTLIFRSSCNTGTSFLITDL